MVESQIQKREYISETPGSIIKDTLTSADKSKISGSDFRAYRSPSELNQCHHLPERQEKAIQQLLNTELAQWLNQAD